MVMADNQDIYLEKIESAKAIGYCIWPMVEWLPVIQHNETFFIKGEQPVHKKPSMPRVTDLCSTLYWGNVKARCNPCP